MLAMMRFRVLLSIMFACVALPALAAEPTAPAKTASEGTVLPKEFGGWQLQGSLQTSKDAATADPANPAILKEYGFTDVSSGVYSREDGRKLTVRAARFADASGAYGAFTFYKQPEMLNEKIGDQGSSLNNRILFYRGNVLVQALFDKLSVMSAAELRIVGGHTATTRRGAQPAAITHLPAQAGLRKEHGKVHHGSHDARQDRVAAFVAVDRLWGGSRSGRGYISRLERRRHAASDFVSHTSDCSRTFETHRSGSSKHWSAGCRSAGRGRDGRLRAKTVGPDRGGRGWTHFGERGKFAVSIRPLRRRCNLE